MDQVKLANCATKTASPPTWPLESKPEIVDSPLPPVGSFPLWWTGMPQVLDVQPLITAQLKLHNLHAGRNPAFVNIRPPHPLMIPAQFERYK